MLNSIESGQVVCRPALAKDKEPVIELCSHIWEGHDYIPRVWDEWLADPEGLLGVAELKGRIAGVFKLTKFQAHEWYMEGLRVHPDFRDKGIASHIHGYVVETWRRMGSGTIRLVTHSENVKVHHMCEQMGFRRIVEFIHYQAAALQEAVHVFTLLNMAEAITALEYVSASPVHAYSACLINLEWVYADPQIKHIQEAISDSHAWWWRNGAGFLSIWDDEDEGLHNPGVQLIGSAVSDLQELLMGYRRLMGALGYPTAGWMAPNHPEVISSLESAGFERDWDKSLYIYELRSSEASETSPGK